MRELTVTIDGKEEKFTNKNKDRCRAACRARLESLTDAQLVGVQIDTDYKEHHRIVTSDQQVKDYGAEFKLDQPWGVEVNINGGGEIEECATRQDAIDFFMCCVEEKGEHWD
jgi:hypothetical protein